VEHALVVTDAKSMGKGSYDFYSRYLILHCSRCGKEIEQWMPALSGHGLKARPKPDWVVEHLASKR
jgi:hypothetical protein